MNRSDPYLSVVVTTRNDTHGGNPLWRLNAFIGTFEAQCRRTGLDAEVIIVEWNPPEDRPRLRDAVALPEAPACEYRFIEVPAELHRTLSHASALPLFQMIGKNVGIRRARGRFVLVTNIDIIFSNELVEFIASRQLETGVMYRVDRWDVDAQLPVDQPLDARMAYCRTHQLRRSSRSGTYPVFPDGRMRPVADDIVNGVELALVDGWHVREENVRGSFRWAGTEASVAVQQSAAHANVLEIEMGPNPFDPGAWVEIEIAGDGDCRLGRFRVAELAMYRLPLSTVPGSITLRTVAGSGDGGGAVALLEARRALAHVVYAIRLGRRDDLIAEPHGYSMDGWQAAGEATSIRISDAAPARADITAPGHGQAAKYGPLRAEVTGTCRFVLEGVSGGDVPGFNAMAVASETWLPSSVETVIGPGRRAQVLTVHVTAGEDFWLMLTPPPGEAAAVTFGIGHLSGAAADGSRVVTAPVATSVRADEPATVYPAGRWCPAADGIVIQPGAEPGALHAIASARGYAVKYGPLCAPADGSYRFMVTCELPDVPIEFGALNGSGQIWLPSALTTEDVDGHQCSMVLTVSAAAGQVFWLILGTPLSSERVPIEFTIRELRGWPAGGVEPELLSPGSGFDIAHGELARAPGRMGTLASRILDRATRGGPERMRRLAIDARHGVVLDSPEFRSIADAFTALQGRHGTLEAEYQELGTRFKALEAQCRALDEERQVVQEELAAHSRITAEMRAVRALLQSHRPPDLHLNACGDFQLMDRQAWTRLGGYPEIHAYSMNLDGMLGTIAHYAGIRENALTEPCCIFHLEHDGGSGWTPEGENLLRGRLAAAGVPWVEARVVSELAAYMAMLRVPINFNDAEWGFAAHELPSTCVQGDTR